MPQLLATFQLALNGIQKLAASTLLQTFCRVKCELMAPIIETVATHCLIYMLNEEELSASRDFNLMNKYNRWIKTVNHVRSGMRAGGGRNSPLHREPSFAVYSRATETNRLALDQEKQEIGL